MAGTTQEQHVTRARLVEAATDLFAAHGYHGTGVADLLEAAGVSRGSFYHFFGAKQDVLFEISLRPVLAMCEVAREISRRDLGAADRVRALAEALLDDIAAHQAAWQVYYRDATQLTGEQYAAVLQARDEFESYWRAILVDGARSGELREVSSVQIKGILGMFNNAVFWFKGDGAMSSAQVGGHLVDLLLDGLRGS